MRRSILGAALALASALALSALPAAAQEKKIRVGYFPQLHDAAILSLEKLLGDKYKFEYVKFIRYADADIALTRGDLDISSLGFGSGIADASRGGEAKIAYVVGQGRGAINLVCRPDANVKTWTDLKGKSVGIVTGLPEIFFNDAVASHGVHPREIASTTFTAAGPPVLQALKDGVNACIVIFEPFAATAVSEGYGVYPPFDLADNSFLGINNGVAVNKAFLAANRQAVEDVVEAVANVTATYKADKNAWIAQMNSVGGFPPEVIKLGVDHVTLDSNLYPAQIAVLAKAMADLGLVRALPSKEAIGAYVDTSILDDLKAKGKVK